MNPRGPEGPRAISRGAQGPRRVRAWLPRLLSEVCWGGFRSFPIFGGLGYIGLFRLLYSEAMAGGFRFLEHLSDVFVEAWGDSLEEAYVQAAKAFYETVSSMRGVEPREERVVEARGGDLQELLYDMIEKLIILFDSEGFLAGEIEAGEIEKRGGEYALRLRLRGEPYDPARHRHGTHVKGVTYHMMMVNADSPVKRLRVLLDI